jgi:hypothetical protein
VSGCGGSSKPEAKSAGAKPFTDSFVHRLVEVGTWDAVEADVSPQLTPQLRSLQAHIELDWIKRVSKAGVLERLSGRRGMDRFPRFPDVLLSACMRAGQC